MRFSRLRFALILTLLSQTLFSQRGYKFEIGGCLGSSSYLGDVGGGNGVAKHNMFDTKLSQTRWSGGGFIKYKFHPKFFYKLSANDIFIHGDDASSGNPARKYRNLSFRNNIYDLENTINYIFYSSNKPNGIYSRVTTYITGYVFTGFGVFYHNPQTFYQGSWVDLQPLKTEGVAYSKVAYSVPMGIGFYVSIVKNRHAHRIGIEFNWRYTSTDYLDDVSSNTWMNPLNLNSPTAVALYNRNPELKSQPEGINMNYGWHDDGKGNNLNKAPRGNPKYNDSYYSFSVTYGISVKGRHTKSRGKRIRSVAF